MGPWHSKKKRCSEADELVPAPPARGHPRAAERRPSPSRVARAAPHPQPSRLCHPRAATERSPPSLPSPTPLGCNSRQKAQQMASHTRHILAAAHQQLLSVSHERRLSPTTRRAPRVPRTPSAPRARLHNSMPAVSASLSQSTTPSPSLHAASAMGTVMEGQGEHVLNGQQITQDRTQSSSAPARGCPLHEGPQRSTVHPLSIDKPDFGQINCFVVQFSCSARARK